VLRRVVCFYADLGNHGYLPLIRRMCESAKAVMPDCETVLLTTTDDTELVGFFDRAHIMDMEITPQNLCASRARLTTSWQLQSDAITLYADPDIVFQKAPEIPPDADILFSWKSKRAAQPINSGLVIAKPGCPEFWKKYASAAINLPKPLNAWWCDQLAYNLVIGIAHKGGDYVSAFDATAKLVDARLMCASAEEGTEESWSLHYKGSRKWNPNLFHNEKSGAGSALAVCA